MARRVTLEDIRTMAEEARGSITKIYLHWSAGHYGLKDNGSRDLAQLYLNDYHFCVDRDGAIFTDTDDLTERKSHTWRRNTGSIAISMACCVFATSNDLGDEPPTDQQIECMSMAIAAACKGLGLDITVENVMTHAEAADLDGYGPATTCERWDLAILKNGEVWMSGGDTLRGKANFYLTSGQV